MHVYYLTHYDVDTFPFLVQRLREEGYDAAFLHTPVGGNEYVNAWKGAWRAIGKMEKGDILVTYMSSAGVLAWLISRLRGKRVGILATNLSLKDNRSLRTRIMAWLYGMAARDRSRCLLSVTSAAYGRTLERRLHLKPLSLPLLRDYGQFPGYARNYTDNGKRVFCGGNSQRHWQRAIALARRMPQWTFMLVGCPVSEEMPVPANVRVVPSLPFRQFMQAVRTSTVVLTAVRWNCPAGLIVLMEAAWEGRLLATFSNDVLSEYVTPARGILSNSVEDLALSIERLYADPSSCARRVAAMQQFLQDECSADAYAARVCQLVNRLV